MIFCVSTVSQVAAQSDCYGTSLDLTIRSTLDPADNGYLVSLPSPQSWIANIGNSQNLRDVPCSEEPVTANSAVHIAARGLLQDDDRALLDSEGARLTGLHIHALSAGGIATYLRSYEWWMENAYGQATLTDMGHLRRPSDKGDAVGGSWLLTESYPDKTGQRIRLGCALDCVLEYRLGPSLGLRYHLIVQNKDETPDWIAIDRSVRRTVLEWFPELE